MRRCYWTYQIYLMMRRSYRTNDVDPLLLTNQIYLMMRRSYWTYDVDPPLLDPSNLSDDAPLLLDQ